MTEHTEARIEALEKGQAEILRMLKPISETYTSVSTLGKWFMAFMVFISILIGILLGLKDYFFKN